MRRVAAKLSIAIRALPPLANKSVVLIDDGLATGVTALVAARYVRDRGADHVWLAVPIGSEAAIARLAAEDVEVITLLEVPRFSAVGDFYEDFAQVEDAEVLDALDP